MIETHSRFTIREIGCTFSIVFSHAAGCRRRRFRTGETFRRIGAAACVAATLVVADTAAGGEQGIGEIVLEYKVDGSTNRTSVAQPEPAHSSMVLGRQAGDGSGVSGVRHAAARKGHGSGDAGLAPAAVMAPVPRHRAGGVALGAPLDHFVVISSFGPRGRRFHYGIDLKAPFRAPVLATAPGVVVYAGRRSGFGKVVEIAHGSRVVTRYAHLDQVDVSVGQTVEPRTTVGRLGATGRATTAHLHYEVIVNGRAQNPAPLLDAGANRPPASGLAAANPDSEPGTEPQTKRRRIGKGKVSSGGRHRYTHRKHKNRTMVEASAPPKTRLKPAGTKATRHGKGR